MSDNALDELKRHFEDMAKKEKPCPTCGKCPTCGRSANPWGAYPQWPNYPGDSTGRPPVYYLSASSGTLS